MRTEISLDQYARDHFMGSRHSAIIHRERVEEALAQGKEVVFDFSAVEATQSFIDELVGALILRFGPDVLERLVFKSCSENVRAILEFVASDRCDQYIKQRSH